MITINTSLDSNSEYALHVYSVAAGPVTVNVAWAEKTTLSAVLFAPDYRTLCDNKAGNSPLNLKSSIGSEWLTPYFDNKGERMWKFMLVNPSASVINVTIFIQAPDGARVEPVLSDGNSSRASSAAALLAHVLDRYVRNNFPVSKADKAVKEALDNIPNNRMLVERILKPWRNPPAAKTTNIALQEFKPLALSTSLTDDALAQNLKQLGVIVAEPEERAVRAEHVKPIMKGIGTKQTYRIDFTGLVCELGSKIKLLAGEGLPPDFPYLIFSVTDGLKTWSVKSPVLAMVSGSVYDDKIIPLFGNIEPESARDLTIIITLINRTVKESSKNIEPFYTDEINVIVEAGRAFSQSQGIPINDFASKVIVPFIKWNRNIPVYQDQLFGVHLVTIAAHEFHGKALAPVASFKGLPFNIVSMLYKKYDPESFFGPLYFATMQLRCDPPYVPTQRWSEWEFLGGEFKSAPAVSSRGENKLDVFVQGTNNHLMHRWWDGARWSGWEDLGGALSEAPCAVSWSENHIDCFVRGADKQLWRRCWDGNIWKPWELIGGEFNSAPTVASWGVNRLDVFVQGTNNHLMHRWWDGSRWSHWEDLGGELTDSPAAVSWGSNRIDCFIRGTDKKLQHKWWDGSRWSHWEPFEGEFKSAPAVSSWAPNRLDIFVQGTNNCLMHKWWDGLTWRGWENLGGELSEGPAAVSWGPNRIDCFVKATDNQLWHEWTWLD